MMAFSELEERISKIRQQNEEIKRRYEEVEEDKKNAAKSNALVQMIPSTVWPERKEPPEYSNPPKVNKQKSATKEQSEHHVQQHHPNEKRKGEGPPPDPKYNFLADAEREEYSTVNNQRESTGNKNHNRSTRGNFKKRGMGKESSQRGRTYHGTHRDEHKPEYEAWRKERNRIDEDRISRQKTAEGNWRREWDNDKAHLVNEISKGEGKATLGDFSKKDGRYSDGSGYANHNRGAYHKSHRGSPRNFHNNSDHSHLDLYDMPNLYQATVPKYNDERTIVATDKSIKITLNQSNFTKGPVTSVKVNSPSIAGTGRVGPRQRTRVTYSSHSDIDTNIYESGSFSRQKSFEDKTKGNHYNNVQRTLSLRRPQSQKKKENGAKSPFTQRKEFKKETSFANSSKHYENGSQSNFVRKEYKDSQKSHYPPKLPRTLHKNMKIQKGDSANVTIDDTIKNEKKEAVVLDDDNASVESKKVDIESSNEIKDDECVIENESKSDIKEEHNENSEYSLCDEETMDENIQSNQNDVNIVSEINQDDVNIVSEINQDDVNVVSEINQDDVNVVSEINQDDVNVVSEINQNDVNVVSETNQDDVNVVSEINQDDVNVVSEINQDDVNVVSEMNQDDVNVVSETNQDNVNILVPSETQSINNDIENNTNDENKIMDNLTVIIDNAAMDSCNSDNNTTSNLKCISEAADTKEDTKEDELIQDSVSNTTNDEKSKESSEKDDSDENNDQNDIVAMNKNEKVSEIIIETCTEETLHPPIDKSVMAPEVNDVTHHNEVPIEKSELSVSNNINEQNTIENTEGRSSICIDKISSSTADIAKDNDVTSEEIVEKKELQSKKTIESAVDKNPIESEVTQANPEN